MDRTVKVQDRSVTPFLGRSSLRASLSVTQSYSAAAHKVRAAPAEGSAFVLIGSSGLCNGLQCSGIGGESGCGGGIGSAEQW